MSDRSWRSRWLRQESQVPPLSEGFVPSFRAYLRGNGAQPSGGSLLGLLAERHHTRGYRGPNAVDVEDNLEEGLVIRHNVDLRDVLWARLDDERLRPQLFDTIETLDEMLRDLGPHDLHGDFVDFLNALFDRENQPYQLRDGAIVERHSAEQWAVVEGLEELAPDDDLRETLRQARKDFFYPRENRKTAALRAMALAFDGAKKRLGDDPKKAFELVKQDALTIPGVAEAQSDAERWSHLFDDLNAIVNRVVRHAGPQRPVLRGEPATEFLFFALAAAVRLLLTTRRSLDLGGS